MRNASIVFDLDGTIADDRHRAEFVMEKRWDEYHLASVQDVPNRDVMWFVNLIPLIVNVDMIVMTGRPEDFRALTHGWFVRYAIQADYVLMRPSQDYRPANEVKKELLFNHFGSEAEAKEKVIVMLDNDERGITFWRGLGFPVWGVR